MTIVAAEKNVTANIATELDVRQKNFDGLRRNALRAAEKASLLIQDARLADPTDYAMLRRAERRLLEAREAMRCMGNEIHELVASAIKEGTRRALERPVAE